MHTCFFYIIPRTWLRFPALFVVLGGSLTGQSEIEDLRAEVDALKLTVSQMAARLNELEAQLKQTVSQPLSAPPPAALRAEDPSLLQRLAEQTRYPEGATEQPWYGPAAWDQLELGMSADQVVETLGTPTFDEPSLNRTIDRVLTFQARNPNTNAKVRGKVKFKRDKAVVIERPNFPE